MFINVSFSPLQEVSASTPIFKSAEINPITTAFVEWIPPANNQDGYSARISAEEGQISFRRGTYQGSLVIALK